MAAPLEESFRRIDDRVTSLEELLTHFERTVSELDGVVQGVQNRLDRLEGRVEAILAHQRGLGDLEDGDELDEKTGE